MKPPTVPPFTTSHTRGLHGQRVQRCHPILVLIEIPKGSSWHFEQNTKVEMVFLKTLVTLPPSFFLSLKPKLKTILLLCVKSDGCQDSCPKNYSKFKFFQAISLSNNWIVAARLAPQAFKAGSKVWDWWVRSIEDAWYASPHPRAARTRAKRAFSSSYFKMRSSCFNFLY